MDVATGRIRGRWQRLADRLGFRPVFRKTLLGSRMLGLVGDRHGYLVAIASTWTLNRSSIDLLVRFPQRHTVLGFRDDLLRNPALVAAFGRRRRLPRRIRRTVVLADGTVLVRLPYELFPPSAKKVERVLDGLIAAMGDHVRTLERLCEVCGRPTDLAIFLSDGVPALLCEPCVSGYGDQEQEIQRMVRELEPDLGEGSHLGVAAGVAFGIVVGALSSICVVLGGEAGGLIAAPGFFVLGYLTAALASRGFVGSSLASSLLKLPLAAAGAFVAWVVMNAVAKQTIDPALWNMTLVLNSVWRPGASSPKVALILGLSALAGAFVEIVVFALTRRRPVRTMKIDRVEARRASQEPEPATSPEP